MKRRRLLIIVSIIVVFFGVGYLYGTYLGHFSRHKKEAVPAKRNFCDTTEYFPDGSLIDPWFHDYTVTDISQLGKAYDICRYGVRRDSTILQTAAIQAVIDSAAKNGGGVIVIPKGVFLSSSLFFRQGTHLYLEEGARLKGSDDISDFPLCKTRMEGQTVKYFCGLVNAEGLDGFTISGKGTLDGNGHRYWRSFWLRRQYNPQCTNMEELRPKLLFISNCKNVQISGIRLINSPFWTQHFYKCDHVKLLGLYIFSPVKPVKAPSTDAVDLDVCSNVLIKDCYMEVNDDAVALKGGKGPWADTDPDNGANERIIVEDCTYGFCHGALTCGSESIHNRNIIIRRCHLGHTNRLLWLKMRPDTPQLYEYITVENITGSTDHFLYIQPWTQFFDLKGREDIPISYADHIRMSNCRMTCKTFFNVGASDQYELSNFTFDGLDVQAEKTSWHPEYIDGLTLFNATVNGENL